MPVPAAKITPEQYAELAAAKRAGASIRDLASRYGVGKSPMAKHVKRALAAAPEHATDEPLDAPDEPRTPGAWR